MSVVTTKDGMMWKPLRLPRITVCDINDSNTTTATEINNHNDVNSWITFRNSEIRLQIHLQDT